MSLSTLNMFGFKKFGTCDNDSLHDSESATASNLHDQKIAFIVENFRGNFNDYVNNISTLPYRSSQIRNPNTKMTYH